MKAKLDLIIDAIMLVALAAMTGIGLLIKYVLISGQDQWIKFGQKYDLRFLDLDRHDWGSIHLIVGFIFLGLLFIHIILHWKLLMYLLKGVFKNISARRIGILLFFLFILLLISFPVFVKPGFTSAGKGINKSVPVDTVSGKKNVSDKDTSGYDVSLEVKGYMSLEEVANKYDVPVSYLKGKLNIPPETSGEQKLGQLKKHYSFTMKDIEIIISNYQNNRKDIVK
jgi:hypothetical protein